MKKTVTRIVLLLLAFSMISLTFVGCGKKNSKKEEEEKIAPVKVESLYGTWVRNLVDGKEYLTLNKDGSYEQIFDYPSKQEKEWWSGNYIVGDTTFSIYDYNLGKDVEYTIVISGDILTLKTEEETLKYLKQQ